ncbi:hypothetical protein ACQE3E_03970 [Methylomonas sp. MED-D]|uniref:Uncharacterized protein n=1 Tax=Methylomonas koyamae TaxID=702114 RepID=A0A177P1Z4_9GAMM|nr:MULTISPECIES: hypothetical protein [Methylomonas]NJA06678.1 hypothetical protein [Methylococcaceae bacterium WWC4]OAI24275.1 hypothetical protein A1355_20885 [Methylomonas koyamae]OHX35423.1 hypothetical protein BJL95_16465 [Methylomonas sp. LWB]WGS86947.1 hypothetical protein QC632_04140 [Methylomonas sp. UP202]
MSLSQDFDHLLEKLNTERESLQLKLHLASMDAKDEFAEAEQLWQQFKSKASEIADESIETSEDYIAKAQVVGEELKAAYQRISQRLTE